VRVTTRRTEWLISGAFCLEQVYTVLVTGKVGAINIGIMTAVNSSTIETR
jgi:hypothetical protein